MAGLALLISPPVEAQEQEASQAQSPTEHSPATGFGTFSKIDIPGQAIRITEYNWETNEMEDILYTFNRLTIKLVNMTDLSELKAGDELEFEWFFWGPKKWKLISKLSKGPMPSEPINMDFNFNFPGDEPVDGALLPVEVKTEGVDVAAPEVVQANELLTNTGEEQVDEEQPAMADTP